MTNEEKAKELSQHYSGESDYKETVGYDCAIAMAEWKAQQLVNKACEWLEEHVRDYKYYDADFADVNIDVDDLIYGFKKAMEE